MQPSGARVDNAVIVADRRAAAAHHGIRTQRRALASAGVGEQKRLRVAVAAGIRRRARPARRHRRAARRRRSSRWRSGAIRSSVPRAIHRPTTVPGPTPWRRRPRAMASRPRVDVGIGEARPATPCRPSRHAPRRWRRRSRRAFRRAEVRASLASAQQACGANRGRKPASGPPKLSCEPMRPDRSSCSSPEQPPVGKMPHAGASANTDRTRRRPRPPPSSRSSADPRPAFPNYRQLLTGCRGSRNRDRSRTHTIHDAASQSRELSATERRDERTQLARAAAAPLDPVESAVMENEHPALPDVGQRGALLAAVRASIAMRARATPPWETTTASPSTLATQGSSALGQHGVDSPVRRQ